MKPLFPEWSNSVLYLVLAVVGTAAIAVPLSLMVWVRAPAMTGQHALIVQPVKFDHRHHVRDAGIQCLYCHGDAQRGPYAGVPATSLCMGCHAQIWTKSPELSAVRNSYFDDQPIVWNRVNNLPKHVFFNHSIHLAKGVGCVTCHGRVDQMASVYQEQTLLMSWCLDCHRNPEQFLRPPERVTDMSWVPPEGQLESGRAVREKLHVNPTTDCSGCHR